MLQVLLACALSGALAAALVALELRGMRSGSTRPYARAALTTWGVANIGFMVFLWFNHAGFPLHLDLMEGTVLQHAERAARMEPVYPAPTPEYVPLAYNVLYYYLSAPFIAAFGPSLAVLRLVSIAAMAISGYLIFRIVQRRTGSAWWGMMATSLLAAAYRVMDAYLDTAHSDAWFLCCALLGSHLLDLNRSRAWNVVGVLTLAAAFWFKQHGALFALGGLFFLSMRDGRKAWPYWVAATLAGPALYLLAAPGLFGSHFHYFTWTVPSAWSALGVSTLDRYLRFVFKHYGILALAAGGLFVMVARRRPRRFGIWEVQFIAALFSGLMGALDPEGSDNVFIPMGTWFILLGTMSLHDFEARSPRASRRHAQSFALFLSFGLLAYDPRDVIASSRADASYADLLAVLTALPGPVYAPSQGQLAGGYRLQPAAHWVALEDMVRGPGRDRRNQASTRQLLASALEPDGVAFILTNYPLRSLTPALAPLADRYVLEADFGDRFKPLRCLPKRWDHGWPRYLYRFERNAKPAADASRVGERGPEPTSA